MTALSNLTIPTLDLVAVIWATTCWLGYNYYANNAKRSLMNTMVKWRIKWSHTMMSRENRIVDSQVINGLSRVVTFFCSTSIFITAGLFASIGASQQIMEIINQISFMQTTTLQAIEFKFSFLVLIFVFSFFKFGWAITQHSYSAVVLAAVPDSKQIDMERDSELAQLMGTLSGLGSRHFNDGIRAYYFATATMTWFIHPLVYMLVVTWVILILHRRDFRSKLLQHLNKLDDVIDTERVSR
ncbi:DUF599 domain-containing protein [Leucothrix arctica]|uniref:DUF599 domain-containing protein n=1 Tax=Leucothrix arctica TaxID=1481894 RepID=A0A317CBW8_9GAMM|nr:DUF599 domain-containing protein [Leucothrix arctica]PWQ95867.1 hypothetical protein DKT75_10820 [Leucothrix arctica]